MVRHHNYYYLNVQTPSNKYCMRSCTPTQVSAVCDAVFGVEFRRKTGVVSLAAQRFQAMIIKHAIHTWRNRVVTLVQLLLPVIFAVFACLVAQLVGSLLTDDSPLTLDLSHFDGPVVPFTSIGGGQLADRYSEVASRYGDPVSAGGVNMDDYLVEIAERSLVDYNQKYIVAGTVNSSEVLVGHFNSFALHSTGVSLSLVDNALLRYAVPGNHRIVTVNHPLPYSEQTHVRREEGKSKATGFSFGLLIQIGLAFLVGSFVLFGVNQRSSKSKHCQFVSGVDTVAYWLAAFVWDLTISFALASVLIIVVVLAFQLDAYSEWPVSG